MIGNAINTHLMVGELAIAASQSGIVSPLVLPNSFPYQSLCLFLLPFYEGCNKKAYASAPLETVRMSLQLASRCSDSLRLCCVVVLFQVPHSFYA
jgi:hypothetical protein